MNLPDFIRAMPKIELHVHLQGSTRPETLLKLAQHHHIALPADTVEGIREWYTFRDFPHFVEIYGVICDCIQAPDDIELLAREFLQGQASQNIRYTELTYTPPRRIPFDEQLDALNRARVWGEAELGVTMNYIVDIPRECEVEVGNLIADWAISGMGQGVIALGLGGPEVDNPPEKYPEAYAKIKAAGLISIPHAGETVGAASIWSALKFTDAVRIGHGVRCLEDPALVEELRRRQIPLEVCPTSNVCLKVVDQLENHPLPHLLEAGLYVTLNSDDPPMFNTTLTEEYIRCADVFGFDANRIEQFVMDALRVTILPADQKAKLMGQYQAEFATLKSRYS
ncbi:MAG: adenosine deaminase [Chloroflexi bacterium]|nr:adenosine deaminase [Chloroflexota bacterium]